MRKITFYFIVSSILVVTFSACRDTVDSHIVECFEEGQYYGLKNLTERSDSFWRYQPNQTRIYRSIGKEFVLKEELTKGTYQDRIVETVLEYLCTWQNTESVVNYANLEYRSVHYSDPANRSARIDIELKVRPIYRNDSIFFEDAMTVITGRYQNFTVDNRDTSDNNLFHSDFEFTADTIVLGKHFQNVYHSRNQPYSPLHTKEQGIVAFFDFYENLYVLERVE
jgi:hypothetical protein